MLIRARATVEIEVEIANSLIERDTDISSRAALIDLIDSRYTNADIVDSFYDAGDLSFELEDVPERCQYGETDEDDDSKLLQDAQSWRWGA